MSPDDLHKSLRFDLFGSGRLSAINCLQILLLNKPTAASATNGHIDAVVDVDAMWKMQLSIRPCLQYILIDNIYGLLIRWMESSIKACLLPSTRYAVHMQHWGRLQQHHHLWLQEAVQVAFLSSSPSPTSHCISNVAGNESFRKALWPVLWWTRWRRLFINTCEGNVVAGEVRRPSGGDRHNGHCVTFH